MATPTPGKHPALPVGATPPVSTPRSASYLISSAAAAAAFSPHARPSPSQSQSQSRDKKSSPAGSNTLYSSGGMGGHPTSSSFGGMGFESPATAAAVAVAMVGGLGVGMEGLGIVGNGMGMGERGEDDDEVRKRLSIVVDILKVSKGRVSEQGVERVARRVGLECLWEDQMGSGGSIRTLVIAGTVLSLEVDFVNNAVGKVSLSYPESPEIVTKHASTAAEIMLRDLQLGPGESPLTKMLDKFAVNLKRLAALDKLSVLPTLNCHEAIAGIYESLKRLHEWEVSRLKEEEDMNRKSSEEIMRTALCVKSGRPAMNARYNVGLSLDYWQERHARVKNAKEPKTWSLIVECAPSSSMVYASVRVTDKWISTDIQKANPTADDLIMETGGPVLDWQEPANILLPTSDSSKGDGAMEGIDQDVNASNSKFPDVMFLAKFDPPLVVPFAVANQIYSSTGATLDSSFPPPTVDSLLFPPTPEEKSELDATYRKLLRQQSVMTIGEGGEKIRKSHRSSLTFQKLEYGRALTELPFSHPRQLVELLPIFRQYARMSSLLERSFGSHTGEATSEKRDQAQLGHTVREEYEDFLSEALSDAPEPPKIDELPVDINVYTQPHPTMRINFPFRKRTADICLDMGMNGTLAVVFENVLDDDDSEDGATGKGKQITNMDLGRILEVSEDIGLFAEFIRKRLQ